MTALEGLLLTAGDAALADELDAPDDNLERARNRVEAIRRKLVRRGRDRVAGRRYAVWLNGADLIVLAQAVLAQAVGDGPMPAA